MGIIGGVLGPKVRFIPARGEALGILIPTHQRPEGPIHCVISNACMNRGFAPPPSSSRKIGKEDEMMQQLKKTVYYNLKNILDKTHI